MAVHHPGNDRPAGWRPWQALNPGHQPNVGFARRATDPLPTPGFACSAGLSWGTTTRSPHRRRITHPGSHPPQPHNETDPQVQQKSAICADMGGRLGGGLR